MPGIIIHLAFAKEILKNSSQKIELNSKDFLSGNLIPDLATNKKLSHYRMNASKRGFLVPNLYEAKKGLLNKKSSLKLGIYSHLYLDYYFIENYLLKEFIFDRENMLVINPKNKKTWTTTSFFSKPQDGGILYKGYNEINQLIINDRIVNISDINSLPNHLPNSGISIFDIRQDKCWKDELSFYLDKNINYTGDILEYNRLMNIIINFAKKFVKEEL